MLSSSPVAGNQAFLSFDLFLSDLFPLSRPFRRMDPYVIQTMAILYFDRDSKEVTQGMDARSFVEKLQQRDNFESGKKRAIAADANGCAFTPH